MSHEAKLLLAVIGMLVLGLSLIAYGSGITGFKFSVGFTLTGWAVSWAALRILDNLNPPRR